MKTFIVLTQNDYVIVNDKKYYYNNVVSVEDNDIGTLEQCKPLVKDGKLGVIEFNLKSQKKEKKEKVEIEKPKYTKSKVQKNKNTKKEEK